MIMRKVTSLLLVGALAASCVSAGAVVSFAESHGNPDGVYVKQISSGKCTLASATMMLRQKSLNEGNPTWNNITQSSVRSDGWVEGVGIRQSFTYYGMTVERIDLSGGDNRSALLELLDEHPEGVEIYDRGVPHAVLLTRYDENEDVFYCADPGLSDQEMALGDSWLKKASAGATQEDIIRNIDCVWVITSYAMKNIPAEDDNDSNDSSDVNESENEDFFDDDNGGADDSANTDKSDNLKPSDSNPSGSDVLIDDDKNTTPSGNDALKDDDAQTATGDVFMKVRSYSTANFSDVDMTEWYAPYVESVYETGLMSGLSGVKAGTFDIDGNMTLAQSVTIASRIYSRYAGDNEAFAVGSGDKWIDPYMRYAEKNNIISAQVAASDAAALDAPVTRAQFAEMISAAISDSECAEINSIKSNQFSDIYEMGTEGRAIYRLCRAGIITGDSHGNFEPDSTINRAQVAAIVARVTDKALRVKM